MTVERRRLTVAAVVALVVLAVVLAVAAVRATAACHDRGGTVVTTSHKPLTQHCQEATP